MNIDICYFDGVHLLGESATHPIELLATCLGVLLLLEGSSIPRRSLLPKRAASSPLGRVQLRNLGCIHVLS